MRFRLVLALACFAVGVACGWPRAIGQRAEAALGTAAQNESASVAAVQASKKKASATPSQAPAKGKQTKGKQKQGELSPELAKWYRTLKTDDLDAMLAALRTRSDEEMRELVEWAIRFGCKMEAGGTSSISGVDAVYAAWAERDLGGAFAALERANGPGCWAQFAGATLGVLARTDLEGALAWLRDLPSREHRSSITTKMMEIWGAHNPWAAALAAFTHPEMRGDHNLRAWAAVAAAEGLTLDEIALLLGELGNPMATHVLLRQALATKSREDPAAVWDWYRRRFAGDGTMEHLFSIFDEWFPRDAGAALAAILAEPDAALRRNLLGVNSVYWGHGETLAQAVPRLLAEADALDREFVVERLAGQVASIPPKMREAMLRLPLGDEERQRIEAAVAEAMAKERRPQEAVRVAAAISSEEHRQRALLVVARQWAAQDEAAARQWAASLTAGRDRDWPLRGVLAEAAAQNPARALEMLPQFASDEARRAAAQTIAVRLRQRSSAELERWLPHLGHVDRALVEDAAANGSAGGFFQPDGQWTARYATAR